MIDKLYKNAEGLNNRFGNDNDPFKIVTRLAEECGEVAAEVNHFERQGIKIEKLGQPNKTKLAKEIQDVMRAALQLAIYYDLYAELEASIEDSYIRLVGEGYIEPITQ